jgi:serine protease Do
MLRSCAVAACLAALAAPATLPAQRPDPIGGQRRSVIAVAAARVAPAVVTVNVIRRQRAMPRTIWEQMMVPRGYERRVEGLGTGFIISSDGLIITNQHVVAGAEQIVVTLRDGREFAARLLGEDGATDIAVVKVDTVGLPVAPIGRSTDLQIGDWVIAIGNPYGMVLGNPEPSVTAGVVSALGRDILPSEGQSGLYVDMIQTDAAINPGNSGGPLVDADGNVVGVNASILSQSGGSVGLGFAIPIERALLVARDLAADGRVRRGWVGIEVSEPRPAGGTWRNVPGVSVRRIAPGGPGSAAGVQPGDLIESANARPLRNFLGWEKALLDLRPGDTLRIQVRRGAALQALLVRATELPSESAERVSLRDLTLITVTPQIQAERSLASGQGALVVSAGPESARSLGIQPGDVILQINNVRITRADQVGEIVGYFRGKGLVRIYFVRGDQVIYADVWAGS